MTRWSIRRWRLPRALERMLDAKADHYRVTMSDGWRIIWLGYGGQPDDPEDTWWLPVALEKVTIHGEED